MLSEIASAKARGLADLPPVTSDSLLALIALANADPRADKIDVGVGVFRDAAGLTLSVTLDGRTRRVEFDGTNILDSARQAGMPAPFACKAGVCATCRARVIDGKVEMAARYGLTDEEVASGYVLTCQSVPKGDGVEVDYDA